MKLLIIAYLTLLASAYPFSRFLQEDPNAIPPVVADETNPSPPLSNDPISSLPNNTDPVQHIITREDFLLNGTWNLISTNCTVSPSGTNCVPQIVAGYSPLDDLQLGVQLTVTYPTDPACGDNSGKTFTVTESSISGYWVDSDPTSLFNGVIGTYNLNNGTETLKLIDINDPNGGRCWQMWGNENSRNFVNATPTAKTWEGAWIPQSWVSVIMGLEDEYCCIPEVPMLLFEDLATQTIGFVYMTPSCDSCEYKNTIITHNILVAGGAGFNLSETRDAGFAYLWDGQFVYSGAGCIIKFKQVPPTVCPNSTVNSTDTSNSTNSTAVDVTDPLTTTDSTVVNSPETANPSDTPPVSNDPNTAAPSDTTTIPSTNIDGTTTDPSTNSDNIINGGTR
jgi:hypothetical protein